MNIRNIVYSRHCTLFSGLPVSSLTTKSSLYNIHENLGRASS